MVEFEAKFEETNLGFDTEFSTANSEFNAEFDNLTVFVESNHDKLANRDMPDQHPITAITGLENELGGKLEYIPAMTNQEIENILKGFA